MAEASKTDCLSLWKGIDMVYCYLIIMVFILFLTFFRKKMYIIRHSFLQEYGC